MKGVYEPVTLRAEPDQMQLRQRGRLETEALGQLFLRQPPHLAVGQVVRESGQIRLPPRDLDVP